MTDAAIADTLNRHAAQLIARNLDFEDSVLLPGQTEPDPAWYTRRMADELVGTSPVVTLGRQAWQIGILASRTPGLDFDSPADCDWENLLSHFRAEILARRDPQAPSVREADSVRNGVGSR